MIVSLAPCSPMHHDPPETKTVDNRTFSSIRISKMGCYLRFPVLQRFQMAMGRILPFFFSHEYADGHKELAGIEGHQRFSTRFNNGHTNICFADDNYFPSGRCPC